MALISEGPLMTKPRRLAMVFMAVGALTGALFIGRPAFAQSRLAGLCYIVPTIRNVPYGNLGGYWDGRGWVINLWSGWTYPSLNGTHWNCSYCTGFCDSYSIRWSIWYDYSRSDWFVDAWAFGRDVHSHNGG